MSEWVSEIVSEWVSAWVPCNIAWLSGSVLLLPVALPIDIKESQLPKFDGINPTVAAAVGISLGLDDSLLFIVVKPSEPMKLTVVRWVSEWVGGKVSEWVGEWVGGKVSEWVDEWEGG